MANPLVSISCITFNHGRYIKQCLDGFLMQKTSFDFEILIHDDASTDNTVDIIKSYQEKYPDLIKPIFQKENQYSKGQRGMNVKFNFPRAQGKYIAMCEGDDYWTDPLKLQKQVDFLEENPDYAACFTNAKITNEILATEERYIQSVGNQNFPIEDVIKKGGALFPTASLIFRNQIKEWPDFIFKHKSGDRALGMLLADKGDFYLLNEVTCVYRRHDSGVFSSVMNSDTKRKEINRSNIELLKDFDIYSNKKYHINIKKAISKRALMALLRGNDAQDKEFYPYLTIPDKLRFVKNKYLKK